MFVLEQRCLLHYSSRGNWSCCSFSRSGKPGSIKEPGLGEVHARKVSVQVATRLQTSKGRFLYFVQETRRVCHGLDPSSEVQFRSKRPSESSQIGRLKREAAVERLHVVAQKVLF